jgi:5-methylcytosine-specific restriction endonuclease McrA
MTTIPPKKMHISKKTREIVRQKFEGKCAYSGTELEDDWQVDHVKPVVRNWFSKGAVFEKEHHIDNMFPCQKIVNHYKGSLDLETFRTWFLGGLNERLKKLPKNPKAEKSAKRKAYLLKVASYFGITENKPFDGVFYFEKLMQQR